MDEHLLIKYFTHTANAEELATIEQWIYSDKKNEEWLFEMERIWSLKDELKYSDKIIISDAYNRFVSKTKENKKQQENKTPNLSIVPMLNRFLRYGAVACLAFLFSFGLFKFLPQESNIISLEYNTVEVPKGQRVSIILSDGTKVWLNAQSKLTYPSQFSQNERKVKLEGEGFFEVSHNPNKPFIVDGELLDVKVLGTKFDFKSYIDEEASVTLAEGKVEVSTYDGENNITLKPSEQIVYSQETGITLNKNVDSELQKSWIKGETIFHNQPLSAICKDLERKFDVNIEIEDSELANQLFTCHFKESLNIQQVMNLLKATRELSYTVDECNITIKRSRL